VRVTCCYTELHPAAKEALPPDAELVYTGDDDFAYWRAIESRLAGAEDLVIIEHDIEIHPGVVPQLAACKSPWCAFPYFYGPDKDPTRVLYQALGCAKFSAQLQQDIPIVQKAADFAVANGLPPVPSWNACDAYICRALITAGIATCNHTPWVTHHRATY